MPSGCFAPCFLPVTLKNRCYTGLVPRANHYFVPGKVYHLTHRCHDRQFLFRFARDRDGYRQALWETLQQAPVSVLAYCIIANHTHVLQLKPSRISFT